MAGSNTYPDTSPYTSDPPTSTETVTTEDSLSGSGEDHFRENEPRQDSAQPLDRVRVVNALGAWDKLMNL